MVFSYFQTGRSPGLASEPCGCPLPHGRIDEKQVAEMVENAMDHSVTYVDTAYPYHGGESEWVIGRVLRKFDRVLPCHQIPRPSDLNSGGFTGFPAKALGPGSDMEKYIRAALVVPKS